jgi:hypothetical protein
MQQYPPSHYYDKSTRPKTEVDARILINTSQNKLDFQIKDDEKPSIIKINNEDTNEDQEPINTNPV